jgi:hypothetical protein
MQTPLPATLRLGSPRLCWICGKLVSLENCKADEQGNTVHEMCYVARIKLNRWTQNKTEEITNI